MSDPGDGGPTILHIRPDGSVLCLIEGGEHQFVDLNGNAFDLTPREDGRGRESGQVIRDALERLRARYGDKPDELTAAGYKRPEDFSAQIDGLLGSEDAEQLAANLDRELSGDPEGEEGCSRLRRLLGLC